jgi:hypothetical protein
MDMRDWGELRQALAPDLGVEELTGGGLLITVDGHSIQLEAARAFDEPWLTAVSPIAFAEQVTRPIDALEWNASLSVGSLAIVGGMLVLRWAWPLSPLDAATLDRYFRFIGRESRRLREIHERATAARTAVDFLAD